MTVTATDNKGAATSETFAFAVDEVPPTAGAPVAAASSPDGTAIAPIDTASHFVSPNGLPLTYAATGLPAGLSIDPTSGRITGTLDHDASKNAPSTSGAGATLDGTYTVTIFASDGQGGVATQSFTIDAVNEAPAIAAQTPDQHATDGQTVSLDTSKAFADPNVGDIVTYAADGLPRRSLDRPGERQDHRHDRVERGGPGILRRDRHRHRRQGCGDDRDLRSGR